MPPRYLQAFRPAVKNARKIDYSRRLEQAQHDFRVSVCRQKLLTTQAENSVVFRKLRSKPIRTTIFEPPPEVVLSLPTEIVTEDVSIGGIVLDATEEEHAEVLSAAMKPLSFEEQMADGSLEHPFTLNEETSTRIVGNNVTNAEPTTSFATVHPPFILEKVDKKINRNGYIRHPPPSVASFTDIFGGSLKSPLSTHDIRFLKLAGIDLDRAAEAWQAIQQREGNRLLVIKLNEEDQENQRLYERNERARRKGRKPKLRSSGSKILALSNKIIPPRKAFQYFQDLNAVQLRVKLIREGVAAMEMKLRRSMKTYAEAWRIISSSRVPYRCIPGFRDLPWPISDGWASAPTELTKEEVKRFLFSKCNISKSTSRAEVFNTAIAFWETESFKKRLLRWYPGSESVPSVIIEGAKLVYAHLQELEEELEPLQAADRNRRLEEELLASRPKKRRFVADVWDKFTGVLRFPTSFDFDAMMASHA